MIRLLPAYPAWTAVVTGLMAPEETGFIAGLKARIAEAGLENRIALLGEPFTPGLAAGTALVVAGIFLFGRAGRSLG